jgi:hypothetical protein
MSAPLFASLSASLLARKGEAQPSKEPSFGHRPWQPPVVPAPPPPPPQQQARVTPPPPPAEADVDVAKAKVHLNQVAQGWPAPKPAEPVDTDGSGWVPNRQQAQLNLGSLGVPFKTTIRLTHAQARAVKLAALVLDKPQQEILTAGLLERLEALACADLARCTCFRAVIDGMKAPEPPAVEQPPVSGGLA